MYLRSWLVLPLKEIVKEEVKVGNDLLLEMGGRLRMEITERQRVEMRDWWSHQATQSCDAFRPCYTANTWEQ